MRSQIRSTVHISECECDLNYISELHFNGKVYVANNKVVTHHSMRLAIHQL